MFCSSRLVRTVFLLFCAFLSLTSCVFLLDKVRKACALLQSHLDSYKFDEDSRRNDLLVQTSESLNTAISELRALPRLHCVRTLSVLSQRLYSQNSTELLYYFTIFFNELTETLLNGACVDLEKTISILRRNLTRPAFIVASLKSFTEEQMAFVHNCLHTDKYYAESLLAEDDQSVLLMSTCLNYQLLLRRIENYSKTVAWHIKRRDPEHCYVGLLQLSLRCFNTMDANARSQNCTPSVNRCHNLVDICLGPIDSSSSMALFHFGKLLKITKQLQAIYDPVLQLRIVNESIDAITIEKTQNVLEDCAILKDGVDMSTNRLEQTERDIRSYVSTLIKRPIDASLVKSKLEDVVNTLRSHLDKVREYLERIEEVAKFVESHVCIPYKKQKRIAPDIKESAGEHLSKEGQAWDEDSSSECEVEALRDISSAYRAAQHSNRKFFNFLLHGSGYEPDLPEGPLLAVELKSAPRIRQTPSPAASPNQRMHFNESEETGQTKLSSQLPEWSTKSTSGLKRLRSFTLLSLGLTFAM